MESAVIDAGSTHSFLFSVSKYSYVEHSILFVAQGSEHSGSSGGPMNLHSLQDCLPLNISYEEMQLIDISFIYNHQLFFFYFRRISCKNVL